MQIAMRRTASGNEVTSAGCVINTYININILYYYININIYIQKLALEMLQSAAADCW